MTAENILPLSKFIGSKFSLSDASPEYAMSDEEAEFMLEILGEVQWSDPVCEFGAFTLRQHSAWTEGANVGLFHDGKIVGFYEGLNLWVHPDYRRQGLAIPLILMAARLRGGSVLTDGAEAQNYSPAGLLAHTTAHLQALLCAIKKNETIPQDVLNEYNIDDPSELTRMFGLKFIADLTCCQPLPPSKPGV
jgi:GNAT superfamily N-acetyltransferase